jgi:hypothetical protein
MTQKTTQTLKRSKSEVSIAVQNELAASAKDTKAIIAAQTKRKAGQPTKFTPEKWELILEAVATYQDLIAICDEPDMPSVQTIYRWIRQDPQLKDDMRGAWEMFSMIGHSVNKNILNKGVLSSGDTRRDIELAADNRWHMGKTNRRDFGDKTQIDVVVFDPVILDLTDIKGEGGDGV